MNASTVADQDARRSSKQRQDDSSIAGRSENAIYGGKFKSKLAKIVPQVLHPVSRPVMQTRKVSNCSRI